MGRLLREMVSVALIFWENTRLCCHILLLNITWSGRSRKDIELILRDVVQVWDRDTQVLSNNFFLLSQLASSPKRTTYIPYRTVQEDFGGKEGIIFTEGTVIKDQQELNTSIKGLN